MASNPVWEISDRVAEVQALLDDLEGRRRRRRRPVGTATTLDNTSVASVDVAAGDLSRGGSVSVG
jgi:hypothetical protein